MSIEAIELFDIFSGTFGKEKAQAAVRDIETLISEHKRELATKEDIKEVKGDIRETELKLTKEIESVRLEVEKAKSGIVKWFAGLLIAYTGVIITILTLLK
ncbi:MAG: hypothetical protein AB1611_04965 [bacterium]